MSLADTLTLTAGATTPGPTCAVGRLLRTLDDDDAAALTAALDDTVGYRTADIWRALDLEGHRVGRQSVSRHRRHECRCEA